MIYLLITLHRPFLDKLTKTYGRIIIHNIIITHNSRSIVFSNYLMNIPTMVAINSIIDINLKKK